MTLPNCLFVVHESFIEFALLLKHRRQVRVRSGELGEYVECLEVQPRRLFDVALLTFDIGQIVQRIGVRRAQPKSCRIAILRILNKTKHFNQFIRHLQQRR